MRKQTLVLAVLDGWGIGRSNRSNPIYIANPENVNHIRHNYPAGTLQASGIAVGMPWGETGDSEVGHLTLGSGKVLYQHYPRIKLAIEDESFFKNEKLLAAVEHAKDKNSTLHLVGLIGESNVHSSGEHLGALITLIEKNQLARYALHLFTDGKDSSPESAIKLIDKLPKERIASVSGRYFALDRDLHWDRTLRVYDMLTGASGSLKEGTVSEFLIGSYNRGLADEFIEPTLLDPSKKVTEGDAVIFFNFREDGMRQLAQVFTDPDAGKTHTIPSSLKIISFTEYGGSLRIPVAFPSEKVTNPIGKVLAESGRVQLRIAETERYSHVTYFFNGFVETPFQNEYRVLIPSRNIVHQDERPEMMADAVTTRVVAAVDEGVYDFILVNYANPDVIAHTGNFDATVEAIRAVDKNIGILTKTILEHEGILVITADHGNAEELADPTTGRIETAHDMNPVPIYVVTRGYERTKSEEAIRQIESSNTGVLSDVAPTVLELMGIPKPEEMSGESLLQLLR